MFALLRDAEKGIDKLRFSEPQAYKKLEVLVLELEEHPEIGTGHPERLDENRWLRRITQKHRLVYRIKKDEAIVSIHSAYGHYEDK
ncbi:MAG: type II toxin-antitoxin system YoeB family toxin [Prevotellaceae bacterium]|jgi:toxin YoeB|nr:type II toxin-antitoxin system YoeB family toxin [Prevotellaceae bacterium]